MRSDLQDRNRKTVGQRDRDIEAERRRNRKIKEIGRQSNRETEKPRDREEKHREKERHNNRCSFQRMQQ